MPRPVYSPLCQRALGNGESRWRLALASAALLTSSLGLACNPAEASAPLAAPTRASAGPDAARPVILATPAAPRGGPDDARGGRLYDDWRAEKGLRGFVSDASKTRALDGNGGPNGNGTLDDGRGRPIPNSGHDYRLKNLFGWDLRGAEGIYGAAFQGKSYVLPHNLLTDTRTAEELEAWLAHGDESVPAFGQVLDEADLGDLVAYIVKTRDGALARPARIFALDERAPNRYVLVPGGDPVRGRARYAISCADCHGDDGRNMTIDQTQSLGSLSRSSAYEVWFKMLNGQPGTDMRRQILDPSGAEQERAILDVLAALCDRSLFPALPGAQDVRDGDPRCASYLK